MGETEAINIAKFGPISIILHSDLGHPQPFQ